MAGSLSTAALSVLLLLVVSRFLGNAEADQFSMAYAISHLVLIIGLFQVRNYQATDIENKYSFRTYVRLRLLTSLMMLISTGSFIWFNGYRGEKALVILLVCLLRLTDALSDVFQGFFQQEERLDLAGKSLFYRNSLVFLSFTSLIVLLGNLIFALFASWLISLVCLVYLDIRTVKGFLLVSKGTDTWTGVKELALETFPLFLTGFLLTFLYNQPKYSLDYFIQLSSDRIGLQKDFNIMFMPVFVMNLMMLFLRPQVTQLAILRQEGDLVAFRQLNQRILKILLGLSLVVLVASYFLGLPILSIVFATDLTPYQSSFMILMIGGVMSSFATLLDNILTVLRHQKALLIPYGITFILAYLLSDKLVVSYGLLGAAYSFTLSMLTCLLGLYLSSKTLVKSNN